MSSNKKFMIQNGAAITGEVTVNSQLIITDAGVVTTGAISASVATLTAPGLAALQSQVDAILGTSPASLDTLQEIVSLFQSEDGDIQTLITNNSAAITAMQSTLATGVASAAEFAALEVLVGTTALDTSASNVADALNELHTELGTLTATQSSDVTSLTTAITTGDAASVATASSDATSKVSSEAALRTSADATLTAAIAAETSARTAAIAAIPGTDLTPYSTTTEMNSSIATAKSEAQSYADQVVAATVDAAPAALDTLNELAAALGDDANFASTVTASIATKATAADLTALEAQITGGVATLSQGALADTALQPADLVANTTAIATNASNLTALETSHSADLVNLTARTYGVTYDPNAANVEVDSTLDMQTNAIINVAAPSAADDAATKAYVDAGQVAAISASAAALSGGLCITYDPATGEIKIDTAETASSLLVADSNNLGSQSPSHYRIDIYDVNGTIVN